MTTRILPRDEYARLAGTELDAVWAHLPDATRVVVVERDGAIVGCHALLPCWHVEGLWIAPGARGRGGVARRLWRAVQDEARAIGVSAVLTAATDDRVRGLLAHVGATKVPGEAYLVPVRS